MEMHIILKSDGPCANLEENGRVKKKNILQHIVQ